MDNKVVFYSILFFSILLYSFYSILQQLGEDISLEKGCYIPRLAPVGSSMLVGPLKIMKTQTFLSGQHMQSRHILEKRTVGFTSQFASCLCGQTGESLIFSEYKIFQNAFRLINVERRGFFLTCYSLSPRQADNGRFLT